MSSAVALPLLALAAAPIGDSGKTVQDLTITQKSESGGTMHYAGPTTLARGGKSVTLKGDSPLLEHQLRIGEHAWLVLGWSSGGSGTMSVELLVVREQGGLAVADRLTWFTMRSRSGVYLQQTKTGWRVGLPQLEPLEDWQETLRLGKRRLDVGEKLNRALKWAPLDPTTETWAYHPPFGDELTPTGPLGWLDVTAAGFKP